MEGQLVEGDLVVLEDRTFDLETGDVTWKARAYGMVFKVADPYFWAFWSDEGRDHQSEPCGLDIFHCDGHQTDPGLVFRYRKFS